MIELDVLTTLFASAPAPTGQSTSVLKMIQSAGIVGYILIALSVLALTMVIMHVVGIRKRVLVPPPQLDVLDSLLAQGDIVAALEYCLNPEHDSYLTRILAAGLTRYQRSAFGAFEIKNAVEESGEEQTARLYRSTDVLGVIGSIAPLLGLTGTVLGIVGAFETLSAGAVPDNKALAANISLALVATLLGLILAIPCMALFTYFRNRIDALAGEASVEIERLLLHLESAPTGVAVAPAPAQSGGGPAARSTPEPRPAFVPRPPPAPSPVAAPKNV